MSGEGTAGTDAINGGNAVGQEHRQAEADVERFDPVHEYEVLHTGERRSEDPKWDVGVKDIVVSPNYAPSAFGDYAGALDSEATILSARSISLTLK